MTTKLKVAEANGLPIASQVEEIAPRLARKVRAVAARNPNWKTRLDLVDGKLITADDLAKVKRAFRVTG